MSTLQYNSVREFKTVSRPSEFSDYSDPLIPPTSSSESSEPQVASLCEPFPIIGHTVQKPSATLGRKSSTRRKKRQFTESVATKWLQQKIYFGVGPRFLGWQFPVYEIEADGSEFVVENSGPRVWRMPEKEDLIKWNPLLEHLKGCFRGVVHSGSTHVPFVTTELDRHDGTILTEQHIANAMATARLLKTRFCFVLGIRLNWCAEVNPRNGSIKFFGWANRAIPIMTAQEIGERIRQALANNGLLDDKGKREIFPLNHPQVLLPFRIDKTTIIDSGILPKCFRKKLDHNLGKMVNYETYSVLAFCRWLQYGRHFSEMTLLKSLEEGCAGLADEPVVQPLEIKATIVQDSIPASTGKVRSWKHSGGGADNPNSFERQHEALLEFCRRMGRVATVSEAMAYVRNNGLFSGSWEQNLGRRRSRVRWILKRIAKTFDASKCRGVRHEIEVGEFDGWARTHASHGIRCRGRQTVDEFGNIVVKKRRGRADWRFVSVFLSVAKFCLTVDPNEDGSLPQARAEELWSRCCEEVPFCERKWAVCRDWLEKQGIIKIVDRRFWRGKAMRWAVCVDLDRLAQWWKRDREPGLLEAVLLREFLAGRWNNRNNPVLNTYTASAGWNLPEIADPVSNLVRPPP